MKFFSAVVVLLILFISTVRAQDDCLDVAAARYLVNQALNYQFVEPTTQAEYAQTIKVLYNILSSDSSTYAIDIFVSYNDNRYLLVQNCEVVSQACFYINSSYFAGIVNGSDGILRYYEIDSNGNIDFTKELSALSGTTYFATQRPYYNTNGWTAPYTFVGYLKTTGRTYEITQSGTGAHIASDRVSVEVCDSSLASSPAVNAARYLAASNNLDTYANVTSLDGIRSFLSYLLTNNLIPFQESSLLATVGLGFNNGNYFDVNDCSGFTSAARPQECSTYGYFGEVRNEAVFGNGNLQIFGISGAGSVSSTPRDSGNFFNTTGRPWFIAMNGYTDPYQYQTGTQTLTARSYAASFNGGVGFADPNTAPGSTGTPSPSCPTPTPSPSSCSSYSASPSPCTGGNSGSSDDDDGTNINFYFANILAGV